MVQLVGKTNSLTLVIVIYLQIFTSPFHKYNQRCTECQPVANKTPTTKRPGTKVGETIIVSDEGVQNESNITYCDKISLAAYGNRSMHCVDYNHCSKILVETSEEVRRLTCGLKYDGSIKVCCNNLLRFSVDSENVRNLYEDDELEESREGRSLISSRSNVTETIVFTDDQPSGVLTSMLGIHDNNKTQDGRDLQRSSKETYSGKFPKDCGFINGIENMDESRIIGGETARRNAWPWFALLMVQRKNFGSKSLECGGTLISDKFVLTAAHCVLEQGKRTMKKSRLTVRLSEFNLRLDNDGELDVGVANIIPHPNFHPKTFKNDIALIELDQQVSFRTGVEFRVV